jgi:DNA-binding FrmR family transcriptional regulator
MPRSPRRATSGSTPVAARSASASPDDDVDTRIVARLRSIEGHVRGVTRMVDDGAYCVDIVHQIDAVQKALGKVSTLILDRHLRHCATSAIRGDDPAERERVLGELLDVFEAGRR